MINNNRIVPIQEISLLDAYATMLLIGSVSVTKLSATDPAIFVQETNSATVLADEPVKTFDFASTATAGTVYFVPALGYEGFTLAGTATETAGDTVDPKGKALYKAELASGTVTITKMAL